MGWRLRVIFPGLMGAFESMQWYGLCAKFGDTIDEIMGYMSICLLDLF